MPSENANPTPAARHRGHTPRRENGPKWGKQQKVVQDVDRARWTRTRSTRRHPG